MKKVYLMMTLILALLLATSGTALAQEPFVFCGDLSEADCTLLQESHAASMELQSGSSTFDVSMVISNIPDAPFNTLDFQITGDAAYVVDPALLETMKGMQADPMAMFSTPEGMTEWFNSVIGGVATDANLTLTLPADLVAMMSTEEQPIPETLSLGLRLVDGFAYVNLDEIAAAMPDADMPPGWIGIDLATLMERAMEQQGAMGAMGGMNTMDPEVMQSYMQMFQDQEFLTQFMSAERVADTEIMGQPAAVFEYTFDYSALFQSEQFRDLMREQMAAMGEMMGEEMDEDNQAEMEEAMSMIGPMFDAMNLSIRQVIGLEDKYSHVTEVHFDWDMTSFMESVEPDAEGPAPSFTFDISVASSDFNSAPEIVAPEDVTIFPIDMMMPSNDM